MREFAYTTPDGADAAVQALNAPGAAVIAGGTEILNWMRLGIVEPAALVDVGGLRRKDGIDSDGEVLKIDALATLNEVGEHDLVRHRATVLSQACLKAASAQVRNRATLGGNILQKTRCPYFRAEAPLPWGCNKRKPGSGCAARQGLNERMAILGWSDACVAIQPSDPVVALACLDAEVALLGPEGRRTLPMTDFHLTQQEAAATPGLPSPAHAAQVETRMKPGEIVTGFRIPLRAGERSAYVKVRERESFEYALVAAAATMTLRDGVIASCRLALGSVAQKPWRLPAAEAALAGRPLTREAVLDPIEAVLEAEVRPLAHNGYKVAQAARAAMRALLAAGDEV
jgi:xanthine dehydrogenase YagS FAD-binding subunit